MSLHRSDRVPRCGESGSSGWAGRRSGFTLIELLVVVAIIVIISTTAVMMVGGFLRTDAVKKGGRVLQSAFAHARQVASAKHATHFLVFNTVNNGMFLYEDTNKSKACDNSVAGDGSITGPDLMSGEPIVLPQNVFFDKVFGKTTGAPYAVFFPDGTLQFYENLGSATLVPDVAWKQDDLKSDNGPGKSDIVLRISKETKCSDKAYCDVLTLTGIVRKVEFRHTKDPEGSPLN